MNNIKEFETEKLKKISLINKKIPQHLAVIMDGNGRWAQSRGFSRNVGHEYGVKALKRLIKQCIHLQLKNLTVFAFSSENWSRPKNEVSFLMSLFKKAIKKELNDLIANNVRLKIIGNKSGLSKKLQNLINDAENLTQNNFLLNLNIGINYGGKWDIINGVKTLLKNRPDLINTPDLISEKEFSDLLSLSELPEPDLLIRTGGERRLSNFLLWKLAYTELFFTDTLWPDFNSIDLVRSINYFSSRQRKFGGAIDINLSKKNIPKKEILDSEKITLSYGFKEDA